MINIDYTAIIVVLNFIVLLIILNKLLYKPINKFLADRKKGIAKDIEDAKQSKIKADELIKQKEAELKNAAEEIRVMKKSAQKEADKTSEEIIKTAREREKKILSDADIQLKHEKEKTIESIKLELADMISSFSEKFLLEKIDKEADKKLINSIIERGQSEG